MTHYVQFAQLRQIEKCVHWLGRPICPIGQTRFDTSIHISLCVIRQTMQHLLLCPMMDTACSTHDPTTVSSIAIGFARH